MNQLETISTLDVATHLDAPDILPAGKLCLEFANTADWHAAEQPTENIRSYSELVDWAARIGMRSEASARDLKSQSDLYPALADQIYAWAIELREAIYRIFVAVATQCSPEPADLAILNEALPRAFTLPEIIDTGRGYDWRWRGDDTGLDGILWPIVRSASRLLTDGEHNRIGQCADDRGCGFLFYDTSRNRSRRWCDMNSCGNRAKSQRHYARHRNV